MITEFTPFASLTGGILIGIAATLLMAFNYPVLTSDCTGTGRPPNRDVQIGVVAEVGYDK